MSIKLVKRKNIDEILAAELSESLGVSLNCARLLLIRGYDNTASATKFLRPSLDDLLNPFDIWNMDRCVDRINQAIANNQKILIFGDYDCDGLTAITIMVKFLETRVSNVEYYVPDRNAEGYGITIDAIKRIISENKPDLFISVDCGITSIAEVDFLKSEGIDVIITDHHEPQSVLPDCIVLNPKIKKQGFYELCGAGVAFKIVQAIGGLDCAMPYIGYAAVATVADIVPLVDENRIIAYFGLKILNSNDGSLAAKVFKEKLKIDTISAQDIMFKIAPRLNAAGRVGDATHTLKMFLADDYSIISDLYNTLNEANLLRQKMCEDMIAEIKLQLSTCDLSKQKIIILYDERWEAGILGIAAARLVEMFNRPAILFNLKDGQLKGSARSTKSINIFDLLSHFGDRFVTFGGHEAAAGVTINLDNFESFKRDANEYIASNYTDDAIIPEYVYDLEVSAEEDCTLSFANELTSFEPTGFCNPLPSFLIKENNFKAKNIPNTNHIKFVYPECEMVMFNARRFNLLFDAKLKFLVTISPHEFRGKKYAQAVVKNAFFIEIKELYPEMYNALLLQQFLYRDCGSNRPETIDAFILLNEKNYCGNLFVAFKRETYENFYNKTAKNGLFMLKSILIRLNVNPCNAVVFMPDDSYPFEYYNNIILLDKPLCEGYYEYIKNRSKAKLYLDKNATETENSCIFDEIPNVKEINNLLNVIKNLFKFNQAIDAMDAYKKLKAKNFDISFVKMCISIIVLREIGLLNCKTFSSADVKFIEGKQAKISDSKFYMSLLELKKLR